MARDGISIEHVALQDATRPLHLEHLRRLVDDGRLVAS
jgi:hypothetical protein